MSIYRISTCIAYDHEQGMFMFMVDGNLKRLPAHYISSFEAVADNVLVTCDTKYHRETFNVSSDNPEDDVEKLQTLLEEF